MGSSAQLPPFAPFPEPVWRNRIAPAEWESCLGIWLALCEAHLDLPADEFALVSADDQSLLAFLVSFARDVAAASSDRSPGNVLGSSAHASSLLRSAFLLVVRLIRLPKPPALLLEWEFLSDFSRVYSRRKTAPLIAAIFQNASSDTASSPTPSLQTLKKQLILGLDSGIKGDLRPVEERLRRLNHLLHASPDTAAFFLAGSDFLDGLVTCYTVMNPPLRKVIITTTYLCLVGLTEGDRPQLGMLSDQLYSLKAAADAHKAGPLNVNDSLVAELVTATPILKQMEQRLEATTSGTTRTKSVIAALEGYRKPGGSARPKRLIKRKIDKGKGIATYDDEADEINTQMHVHRMSQISQIQDLFPDLGSGFVSKLLDEYGDNNEQVIAHLLEDSLPPHLASADRSEDLAPKSTRRKSKDLAPRPTPPLAPARHNVYDDDELDTLAVDVSKLHFGKRDQDKTADDVLNDRSTAPNKAAILSALAAFDADDDERDDTYDAADAGFVVNDGHTDDADDKKRKDANEEVLFRAYQANKGSFERDAATRRSPARDQLKQETGMTDEAIEGWAVMLGRNPQQMKQLENRYSGFDGNQSTLASTAWRASPGGSGAEDSDRDGGSSAGGGRGRGRGRAGPPRGRGGRGGNVAGPTGDKGTENARKNKESNKGSRANHNRRDQRARKMARGGFPG